MDEHNVTVDYRPGHSPKFVVIGDRGKVVFRNKNREYCNDVAARLCRRYPGVRFEVFQRVDMLVARRGQDY